MSKRGTFWGLILIIIGVLLFVNKVYNFTELSILNLWPLFVLIPGLSFEYGYFSNKRDSGLLVPGGILTTIGILFLFETFTNWQYSAYTWPAYPLAVAIGLFQLYLFGQRAKGLLIPVFILTAVSVISFLSMVYGWENFDFIIPIILIILGVLLLINNFKRK